MSLIILPPLAREGNFPALWEIMEFYQSEHRGEIYREGNMSSSNILQGNLFSRNIPGALCFLNLYLEDDNPVKCMLTFALSRIFYSSEFIDILMVDCTYIIDCLK